MSPVAFKKQDYKWLKRELQHKKRLFLDPEFPPELCSVYGAGNRIKRLGLQWKRPNELVRSPKLIVEGTSVDDVSQGVLGNCWFVAACSALVHNETLIRKVMPNPDEQEWDPKYPDRYAGIFHFHFWRFGQWVDVVIDDMLPCKDGSLVFAHSKTHNEFWSALLEKAFAKMSGSYDALVGGALAEALVYLSGGVPETISLTSNTLQYSVENKNSLFVELKESAANNALIAAAINVKSNLEMEQTLSCGLVKGHSYAITAIKGIELSPDDDRLLINLFKSKKKIRMVRLQNPWGEKEWNGPWSDGSREWDLVTTEQKRKLGLTFCEDGEFWMTWEDFLNYFSEISVCHMMNTSFFSLSQRYVETSFYGSWVSNPARGHLTQRAGGCLNYKASCLCNPQYLLDIKEDLKLPCLFCLCQEDVREKQKEGMKPRTMGFFLMKVEDNRIHRLHQPYPVVTTSDYINSKSVFLRVRKLARGRYVIVPSTFTPGEEANFLLRIFLPPGHEQPRELVEDLCHAVAIPRTLSFKLKNALSKDKHRGRASAITRIRVVSAKLLQGSSAYCVVTCEGHQCFSQQASDSDKPEWDFWTLFLRRKPDRPILLQIWDGNLLKDKFLGQVILDHPITNDCRRYELTMSGRDGRALLARVTLEMASFSDPSLL